MLRQVPETDSVIYYTYTQDSLKSFYRGQKRYELSNHLGKVLSVITDRRIQACGAGDVMHYNAQIVSVSDYYPFGMGIKEREWKDSSFGYRYGFNGQEQDNEVSGSGNNLDYGARTYDSRLCKWFSADPKEGKYPSWSPYHFGYNSPITTIDPNGEENIVLAGAQNDDGAGNKLMFVHQAMRQLKQYSKNEQDESRTLIIYSVGYSEKQLNRIKHVVGNKYGANVLTVTNTKEVTNYVNNKTTTCEDLSTNRSGDPISNIDAFAHGVVGSIEFGYGMGVDGNSEPSMSLNKTNIGDMNQKAFQKEAIFSSYACRTGLGNADISGFKLPWENENAGQSLAQGIANTLNITVQAYKVRTDYSTTLSSTADRLMIKQYQNSPYLQKVGHWKMEFSKWEKRLENREMIDGAAFDPEGAVYGVQSGLTPIGVDAGQETFTPKEK